MTKLTLPDAAYLRECLDYYPDTGILFWRERPIEHFAEREFALRSPEWIRKHWNTMFAGKQAGHEGTRRGHAYHTLCLDRVHFTATRVIWKWMTGNDPVAEIDHINCDSLDDRWLNLREANRLQNILNRKAYSRSGLPKGVNVSKRRFVARIVVDGERIILGSFGTAEEAGRAYAAAADAGHGEFAKS